jgi:hypothetical protein
VTGAVHIGREESGIGMDGAQGGREITMHWFALCVDRYNYIVSQGDSYICNREVYVLCLSGFKTVIE